MALRQSTKWLLGLLLLLAIGGSGVGFYHWRRPKAVVDSYPITQQLINKDIGTVIGGKEVTETFRIRNTGRTAAHITKVTISCSCTTADVKGKVIEPGGILTVPVHVKTLSTQDVVDTSVVLEFDNTGPLRIACHGTVIVSGPQELAFGRVKQGEQARKPFVFRDTLGVIGEKPHFTYDKEYFEVQADTCRDGWLITVGLCKTIPLGAFEKALTIKGEGRTNADHGYSVDVRGYVKGKFEVEPNVVSFGMVKVGQPAVIDIPYELPYGDAITGISVQVPRGVEYEVVNQMVKLRFKGDVAAGVYHEKATIAATVGGVQINKSVDILAFVQSAAEAKGSAPLRPEPLRQ